MGNFKIISLDLDDTLLSRSLTISQRNRQAIAAALAAGVAVTISTGRMYRSAVVFARLLGLNVPLICYQGALIRTVEGETLLYKPVEKALAQDIIRFGLEQGLTPRAYVDEVCCAGYINADIADYAIVSAIPVKCLGDLAANLPGPSAKVLLSGPPDLCQAVQETARQRFGDSLYITSSRPHLLEFMHPEASKGAALTCLATRLGIKKEEIMAVGDNYNDIKLLEAAGLKIAMGNAVPELKALADYVTANCEEDGVALAIEKFVLS